MNNNVKTFLISRAFAHIDVWVLLVVPYLIFRGLSLQESFWLSSFYAIVVMVFEYPTGVLGDYLGHKTSIMIGDILFAASFILLFLPLNLYGYGVALGIQAIGKTLRTGSEEALLKEISYNDFTNTYRVFKSMTAALVFFSSVIAGIVANINISLTLLISAFTGIFSVILLRALKYKKKYTIKENLFKKGWHNILTIESNNKLLILMLFFAIIKGYMASVKINIGAFTELFDLEVAIIGVAVGANHLVRPIAYFIEIYFRSITTQFILFLSSILLALSILFANPYILILLILSSALLLAMVRIRLDIRINNSIPPSIHASILSFRNLITRLFNSIYLAFAGYILNMYSVYTLLIITGIMLLFAGLIYYIATHKHRALRV